MKVMLVNGSPNAEGCTYTALMEVASSLEKQGVDTEIFQLGKEPISGCIACRGCYKKKRCVIDDKVNEFLDKAENANGFVFGSPVHFSSASGTLVSFMDRVFYSNIWNFNGKVGASVVSCRRAGSTATFDQLNKYFTINNMPIVSSQYWNAVHGNTPEEVKQDLEGLQTMRVLGSNMAWLIKCIEQGKSAGIPYPEYEKHQFTNFIR